MTESPDHAMDRSGPGPRILVPIDGSDPSIRALRYAANLAKSLGATLTVVHFTDTETETTEQLLDRARTELSEAGLPADPEVQLDVELDLRPEARVGELILDRVAEEGYDQVVMGHHGAGAVERAILGSAAQTVIRAEAVPVTVVP